MLLLLEILRLVSSTEHSSTGPLFPEVCAQHPPIISNVECAGIAPLPIGAAIEVVVVGVVEGWGLLLFIIIKNVLLIINNCGLWGQ